MQDKLKIEFNKLCRIHCGIGRH